MWFRYYRLKSLIDNKSYVGKTKFTLEERLQRHHINLKCFLNGKHNSSNCGSYQIIQDKVEGVDYIIELIFEIDVEQEPTERVIEQIFINNEKAINPDGCCNIKDAYTSPQQTKEYHKEYYIEHLGEIKEYQKEYYIEHQDKINDNSKKYYIEHQDKLNQKFTCEICGGNFTYQHKIQHCRSNKHKDALKNQSEQINSSSSSSSESNS